MQQQHKTVEMVANNQRWVETVTSNKEKHKYNSQILTGTRRESIKQ